MHPPSKYDFISDLKSHFFAFFFRNHNRGEIRIKSNGIRERYNGKTWRAVCTYDSCNSFVVAHGYCHRHNIEMRKKTSEILSSLDDTPRQNIKSKSQNVRPLSLTIEKPQKGDIQCIRQQWNGTKWYSLCHYYTQDCTRRSAGIKCAYLCDAHYKEYLARGKDPSLLGRNDQVLLSPRVKRKKM